MTPSLLPDRNEMLHALSVLTHPDQVSELRIPEYRANSRFTPTKSGYFNDNELLATAAARANLDAPSVYITLNPTDPKLLARCANKLRAATKDIGVTGDDDICRRLRFFIDLDPVRPSGISSSADEHRLALEMAYRIRDHLLARGWPAPIIADSGNGVHLLFAVDLPNDAASRDLIKRVLLALAAEFDTDSVKIDTTTFNASRLIRLYGSVTRKGDCTEDRPHRRSRIVEVPERLVAVSPDLLLSLAATAPSNDDKPRLKKGSSHRKLDAENSDQIPQGKRHPTLVSLAGTMRQRGMSAPEITAALLEVNARRCSPPLPESKVQRLAEDVASRYAPRGEGTAFAAVPGDSALFARVIPLRAEVVGGLLRGQQLCVLGGTYGLGKTPLVQDLAVRIAHGLPWCERSVAARPVVCLDFETPAAVFKVNLERICRRLAVPCPDRLEVYLEHDARDTPSTASLLNVLHGEMPIRFQFLRAVLLRKPDAVVIIDPFELLFPIEKRRETDVLIIYQELRFLLADFPTAAFVMTFNLRKRDRNVQPPNLLVSPREWLEEVSGSIEIMNRSDVRVGFDFFRGDPEIRVLNGVRRGEDFHPVLLRPVGVPTDLEGFEQITLESRDLELAFTEKQLQHWHTLPVEFKFEDVADHLVPRSSLSRLLCRAESLGLIERAGLTFRRRVPSISMALHDFVERKGRRRTAPNTRGL